MAIKFQFYTKFGLARQIDVSHAKMKYQYLD